MQEKDSNFKLTNLDYIGEDATLINQIKESKLEGTEDIISDLEAANSYMMKTYGYLLDPEQPGQNSHNVKSCDDDFIKDNIAQQKIDAAIQKEIANYKFEKVQPTKDEIDLMQKFIEPAIAYARCQKMKSEAKKCNDSDLEIIKNYPIAFEKDEQNNNKPKTFTGYSATGNVVDIIVKSDGSLSCKGIQQPCYIDEETNIIYDVDTAIKVDEKTKEEKIVFSYNEAILSGEEVTFDKDNPVTIAAATLQNFNTKVENIEDIVTFNDNEVKVNISGDIVKEQKIKITARHVTINKLIPVKYAAGETDPTSGNLAKEEYIQKVIPGSTKYIVEFSQSDLVKVIEGPVFVSTTANKESIEVNTGEELYFDQATEKFEKRLTNLDKATAEFDQSMEEAQQVIKESKTTSSPSGGSSSQGGQCAIGLISLLLLVGAVVLVRK